MKFLKREYVEYNVTRLLVNIAPRYWEDATINGVEDTDGDLVPFRTGDALIFTIDLETGTVINWPEGTTANMYYKVCDAGVYSLIDEAHGVVCQKDGYVPAMIGEYGDYIKLEIDEDGKITHWNPDLEYFEEDDD